LPPVAPETTAQTGRRHVDGTVSLARAEPGTGSAQYFFICIGDQPALDFGGTRNPDGQGFAAFGRVVRGMDVVRRIHALPADGEADSEYMRGQMLTEPVRIERAVRNAR
jgi:peptidyl-prolyl cis-trans isomerase A (cyclophilin A)